MLCQFDFSHKLHPWIVLTQTLLLIFVSRIIQPFCFFIGDIKQITACFNILWLKAN